MTPATLREWIKQRRLSHQEAADLLAISRDGLRKKLYKVRKIDPQTIRIMELLDDRMLCARELLDRGDHALKSQKS